MRLDLGLEQARVAADLQLDERRVVVVSERRQRLDAGRLCDLAHDVDVELEEDGLLRELRREAVEDRSDGLARIAPRGEEVYTGRDRQARREQRRSISRRDSSDERSTDVRLPNAAAVRRWTDRRRRACRRLPSSPKRSRQHPSPRGRPWRERGTAGGWRVAAGNRGTGLVKIQSSEEDSARGQLHERARAHALLAPTPQGDTVQADAGPLTRPLTPVASVSAADGGSRARRR